LLPRILITGGAGFVGTHLVAHLVERAASVAVLGSGPLQVSERIRSYELDVRDENGVRSAIHDFKPSHVCHLAAISSVAQSWSAPRETLQVNVFGTFNVVEAARCLQVPARILNVSTAQVYAASSEPLTESSPISPKNPYAASKAMAEMFAAQYHNATNGGLITARSFNHAGPGQAPDYVLSSIARQFAEMEAGVRGSRLSIGNTYVKRDFTDVRDVVEAYFQLLVHGTPGETYNVCSGQARSVRDVIHQFEDISGIKAEILSQESRRRPGEVEVVCGNPNKIHAATGWKPRIPFRQTLQDLLDYWRGRIRKNAKTIRNSDKEIDAIRVQMK